MADITVIVVLGVYRLTLQKYCTISTVIFYMRTVLARFKNRKKFKLNTVMTLRHKYGMSLIYNNTNDV